MTKLRATGITAMTATANIGGALLIGATALLTSMTANADDDCRARMDIFEEYGLDGISDLSVDAGAGKLVVIGDPDLTRAEVTGVACASDEDDLKRISVESSRDGTTLELRTEIPRRSQSWIGNNYARLDLEIRVPNNYPLRIVDTSGSMTISNIAAVEIEDGSGSINVQDVRGDVEIIEDGSGSITVVRAGGVHIREDGSGSITTAQIENDVYVGRDGSGSISAEDVGGSFTVKRDSTGSVNHRNVAGTVQISD